MRRKGSLKAIACAVAVAVGFSAWAHFPIYVERPAGVGLLDVGWTPIQLGVYSDRDCPLQLAPGAADVYGVAVGLLMVHQHSAVLSASLFNHVEDNYLLGGGGIAGCNRNFGLEIGLLNMTGRNFGVTVGLFNLEDGFGYRSDKDPCPLACGLQIGLINAGGGLQIGLFNYNEEALIPLLPIINFPW